MKKSVSFVSLFLLITLSFQSVAACGPFTMDPLFAFSRHADYPLEDFAKGKIGIVPPSYGRMSLFLFYRQLSGLPLSDAERTEYLKALENRIGGYTRDGEEPANTPKPVSADDLWRTSRAKVFSDNPKLAKEKRLPDDYFYYTSCLDDAFATAAKTLDARIAKHGIGREVKAWVEGQDAVFSNCGGNGTIPAEAAAGDPDWFKSDRKYQIAAATMYKDDNNRARRLFQEIAADANSVWKETAKFVVARTFIREASLIDDTVEDFTTTRIPGASNANAIANFERKVTKTVDQKKAEKADLFGKAAAELMNILSDQSMRQFHNSANRLLNLVGFRAKPQEQRRILAQSLVSKSENSNFYHDLVDYIWLLDTVENQSKEAGIDLERKESEAKGVEYDYEYALKRRHIAADELGSDLTDWLFTYQTADGFDHSAAKWRETKRLPWLVAALVTAKKDSAGLDTLLRDADQIKPDSPAYATLRHHQVRLLIDAGRIPEARTKLDEVTGNPKLKYARSTENDFLSQKMQLSSTLDEYLKNSQRKAAVFVLSDDANERGDDLRDDDTLAPWKSRTMFDLDSASNFNQTIPLSVLRRAALSNVLPDHLKKFLVIAVWTRAFLLGERAIQAEFTPLMRRFAPEYKVTGSDDAASLLAIGRNPVIQPYVPVGFGRGDSPANSIDSIRGNWWCAEKDENAVSPAFLTPQERTAAAAEVRKISGLGESATFIARRALDFATKNPKNPAVPEILHLAVRSTRHGCRDANTLQASKAAFDFLHKRFPRSPWTAKTPYYFGERSE